MKAIAFALLILFSCSTPTIKKITSISEKQVIGFQSQLLPENYVRNFSLKGLPEIEGNNKLSISLSYLLRNWPIKEDTNIVQIAIRTRGLKRLSLNLKANHGFKIKRIYGFDKRIQLVGDEDIKIRFKKLAPSDWRIILVEIWGNADKGEIVPLLATAKYGNKKIPANNISLQWQQDIIAFSNLDTTVSQNAILYANALTLIEVSRLFNQLNYIEADRILTIQLNNIRMYKLWKKRNPFKEEEHRLYSIKNVLHRHIPIKRRVAMYRAKTIRQISAQSLTLANDVGPGPWSLIASLFGSLFFK